MVKNATIVAQQQEDGRVKGKARDNNRRALSDVLRKAALRYGKSFSVRESMFLSNESFASWPPPAGSLGARFQTFTEGVVINKVPIGNLVFSSGETLFATVVCVY